MRTRLIAAAMTLALFIGYMAPLDGVTAILTDIGAVRIVEASAYDDVFEGLVKKNIADRLTYNGNLTYNPDGSINGNRTISDYALKRFQQADSKCFPQSVTYTEDEVKSAIENSKAGGINYSVVPVSSMMESLLGNGKYVFYLQDDNTGSDGNYHKFIEYNTMYFGSVTYGTIGGASEIEGLKNLLKELTTANPWTSKVIGYDNVPLSPGLDYNDAPMNSGYTIGQLIVDYVHATNASSGLVEDSRIIAIYDSLAEDAGSPFIDMTELNGVIQADINAGNIKSSADRDYTEMLKTDNMITYRDYVLSLPEDQPIPVGTLFIGTWLIDAQSMTEPFYQMAVDSMSTYNQQVMLYKSELSSGYWKNIYGATGIEDILPTAENVPESETNEDGTIGGMAAYYIDIVVGSDGIPRRAKTGQEVDIFSLVSPYEMETLPELRAMNAIFYSNMLQPGGPSVSNNYLHWELYRFLIDDQPYDYTVTDINDPNYTKTVTLTKEEFQEGCDYILSVANKTDIAFYAQNPQQDVRMEESGRGFLNSLELTADTEAYADGFLRYNWNGHGEYSGRKKYISMLIRGSINWDGEKAWQSEINALPKQMDTFNRYSQIFRKVWIHKSQIHDEVTDNVDNRMENIRGLYRELCLTGDADDRELAYEAINVENSLDSLRRYEAYYNLVENENANFFVGPPLMLFYEIVTRGDTSIGDNMNLRWNSTETFVPNDALTAAVEEAIVDSTTAMYKYQQQALSAGTTITSQVRYDLSNNVIDNAPAGTGAVKDYLRQLVDLGNIEGNVIAHKTRELSMLESSLIPTADVRFSEYVHGSVGEAYQTAVADPATSQNTLDEILKDQKASVSAVASELQAFIKARAMRLSTDDAIAFIKERIDWADALRDGITTDAFGTYATEALDEHIRWLQDLLATIGEGGSLTDDGTDYSTSLDKYESELLDALNDGDLDAADDAERGLAQAKKALDEAEARGKSVMDDPDAAASDKATAPLPNTPTGTSEKLKKRILEKIDDNDFDELEPDLEALNIIDPPGLPPILDELNAHGAPPEIIHLVEDYIGDPGERDFDDRLSDIPTDDGGDGSGLGDGDDGDGNGNGNGPTSPSINPEGGDGNPPAPGGGGNELTPDDISGAVNDVFGLDEGDLSDEDASALLGALQLYYGVHGDGSAYDAMMDILQELIDRHSVFIYRQYMADQSREYVSLAAVSRARRYTRFRLVQKDKDVTMSQIVGGSASYIFNVGTSDVTKNNGDTEKMDVPTMMQTDEYLYGSTSAMYPYICEESSGLYLYNTCAYVPDTDWAVLITPVTDKKISQLLDMLDVYAENAVR